jgi:class 3 adenylate cyclase
MWNKYQAKGVVLFGLLDIDTRSHVKILGSSINLASRLESVGVNDQIIISHYVKYLVDDKFNLNQIILKKLLQSFPGYFRI